jgi:hypothetical protein
MSRKSMIVLMCRRHKLLDSVYWDDRWMMNWEGCLEASDLGLVEVLTLHLPGETEENHHKPQTGINLSLRC